MKENVAYPAAKFKPTGRFLTVLLLLVLGVGAVVSMVIVDHLAPCSRTGPVASLDLAYHMPQPYAKTEIWLNLLSPTCFAVAAGVALRGGRGFVLGVVVWLLGGFAIWYLTDPVIWHDICGA